MTALTLAGCAELSNALTFPRSVACMCSSVVDGRAKLTDPPLPYLS